MSVQCVRQINAQLFLLGKLHRSVRLGTKFVLATMSGPSAADAQPALVGGEQKPLLPAAPFSAASTPPYICFEPGCKYGKAKTYKGLWAHMLSAHGRKIEDLAPSPYFLTKVREERADASRKRYIPVAKAPRSVVKQEQEDKGDEGKEAVGPPGPCSSAIAAPVSPPVPVGIAQYIWKVLPCLVRCSALDGSPVFPLIVQGLAEGRETGALVHVAGGFVPGQRTLLAFCNHSFGKQTFCGLQREQLILVDNLFCHTPTAGCVRERWSCNGERCDSVRISPMCVCHTCMCVCVCVLKSSQDPSYGYDFGAEWFLVFECGANGDNGHYTGAQPRASWHYADRAPRRFARSQRHQEMVKGAARGRTRNTPPLV